MAFSASELAKTQMFRCDIRDNKKTLIKSAEPKVFIQNHRSPIGKIFENKAIKDLTSKEITNLSDIDTITWEKVCFKVSKEHTETSLDDIKCLLPNIFNKENKAYIIYNPSTKKRYNGLPSAGVPIKSYNLLELNKLLELKLVDIKENDEIFLDALLVENLGNKLRLKVIEIKHSDSARDFHKFQAVIYLKALQVLFKDVKNIEVSNEVIIGIKSYSSIVDVNIIPIFSTDKTLATYLRKLSERVDTGEKRKAPFLKPLCISCGYFPECFNLGLKEKSASLYKTLMKINNFLYEKGLETGDDISKELSSLEEFVNQKIFKSEYELISKYGFFDIYNGEEAPKVKIVRERVIAPTISPYIIIGISCISDVGISEPPFLSFSILIMENIWKRFENNLSDNQEDIYTQVVIPFKENLEKSGFVSTPIKDGRKKLGELFSIIIAPISEKSYNNFFYKNQVQTLLDNLFKNFKDLTDDEILYVYYFDELSKKIISDYTISSLLKTDSRKISDGLYWFLSKIRHLSNYSEPLTVHSHREFGAILQRLLSTSIVTNTPYSYKPLDIKAINSIKDPENYVFNSNFLKIGNRIKEIDHFEFNSETGKLKELQKKFTTIELELEYENGNKEKLQYTNIFSYIANFSFLHKEGYFNQHSQYISYFYFNPDKIDFIEYISILNYELARLYFLPELIK